MAYSYPPELRERVDQLREQGWSRAKIARELGVSESTILRWTDPHYHEQQRRWSRERKHARKHPCPDCGKPIWHTSTRCASCQGRYAREHRYWTRERIIKAIQTWAREHGRQPTATDWVRSSKTHPSASGIYGTVDPEFPSWSEALKAAGFTTRKGIGRGNSRWTNEQAIELRRQGLSDQEIGARFGVTANAIAARLGPRNPKPTPVPRQRTREQRIADLKKAVAKGEQDGHRPRKGNDRDRAGNRAGAKR